MNKNKLLIPFILISVIIIFSCTNPDDPPEPTPSPTPGITPPVVTGVEATKLQYTDRIRVTWDSADGAESYRIYRYLHKSAGSLDDEFTSTTNYFEDTDASQDTPYFYKVASVIGSTTSDVSANFVEGIYSTTIDAFELNDDSLTAQEVISAGGNTAVMYSFSEGEAQDIDWFYYAYTGSAEYMSIRVEFSTGNSLIGNLMLEIETNSDTYELSNESNPTDYYTISEDFYFRIYFTEPDADIDVIGEYTIYLDFI